MYLFWVNGIFSGCLATIKNWNFWVMAPKNHQKMNIFQFQWFLDMWILRFVPMWNAVYFCDFCYFGCYGDTNKGMLWVKIIKISPKNQHPPISAIFKYDVPEDMGSMEWWCFSTLLIYLLPWQPKHHRYIWVKIIENSTQKSTSADFTNSLFFYKWWTWGYGKHRSGDVFQQDSLFWLLWQPEHRHVCVKIIKTSQKSQHPQMLCMLTCCAARDLGSKEWSCAYTYQYSLSRA